MRNISLGSPRFQKPEKLLIEKLEGPFDEKNNLVEKPIKGRKYYFKAYTNSISNFIFLGFFKSKQVKWGKLGNSKIEELREYTFTTTVFDSKKNCFVYTGLITYEHMRLYAYLDSPSDKASILCKVSKGFHYKGTKKWGKLQDKNSKGEPDFSALSTRVTDAELDKNLDQRGKQNVATLKRLSALDNEYINFGISIVESIYEYGVGTRQVLSDDDDIENKVIDNFYKSKYGKKLSFDENSIQSKKLHTYQPFQNYFKNYLEVIKILLKEKTIQKKDGDEIKIFFTKNLGLPDFKPNFSVASDMLSHDYYGFMGGTQTIKVDLEITELETDKYEVKTKMYIGDWYGADWGDINGGNLTQFLDEMKFDWKHPIDSVNNIRKAGEKMLKEVVNNKKGNVPSLNAFFWLQHYYGCNPFESEIIYKDTNYIQL